MLLPISGMPRSEWSCVPTTTATAEFFEKAESGGGLLVVKPWYVFGREALLTVLVPNFVSGEEDERDGEEEEAEEAEEAEEEGKDRLDDRMGRR